MATSIEDLTARVERLEHLYRAEDDGEGAMERSESKRAHPLWQHIPFGAWLKISGPTFAVMALGFGALWNAQQATTQQILDLQESTTTRILDLQQSTTAQIMDVQQSTTAQIMDLQRSTTAQIMDLQRSTTERLLEMQDRLLEMQQQILDMNRESRATRG